MNDNSTTGKTPIEVIGALLTIVQPFFLAASRGIETAKVVNEFSSTIDRAAGDHIHPLFVADQVAKLNISWDDWQAVLAVCREFGFDETFRLADEHAATQEPESNGEVPNTDQD